MSRTHYVVTTTVAALLFVLAFAAVAIVEPRPRIIWNASASVPIGLYAVHPAAIYQRGDLVAVRPPTPLARWLDARSYLPTGVPLLKRVAGAPGQSACRTAAVITVDGLPIGRARSVDRRGRPLPAWHGCRRIGAGELFLMNARVPDSFDGRYFGLLPASSVIGRAVPIATRAAAGAPLHWELAR